MKPALRKNTKTIDRLNQSINQLTANQPVNQSINQSINQSTANQPASQSINQTIDLTVWHQRMPRFLFPPGNLRIPAPLASNGHGFPNHRTLLSHPLFSPMEYQHSRHVFREFLVFGEDQGPRRAKTPEDAADTLHSVRIDQWINGLICELKKHAIHLRFR